MCFFFFSSRRRHTRSKRDWSSDVCSSDLRYQGRRVLRPARGEPDRQSDAFSLRSEERRVGKSVDLGGRRIIKKKKNKTLHIVCKAFLSKGSLQNTQTSMTYK